MHKNRTEKNCKNQIRLLGNVFSHRPGSGSEPHVFIWTTDCVRACARLRPNRARRRIRDVISHAAGPSKSNNRFFAPFITGAPAGHIKAVEIRSGYTLYLTRRTERNRPLAPWPELGSDVTANICIYYNEARAIFY